MNPGRVVRLLAIALAVVVPVRLWVLEPIYIASASMEPTLPVGRKLFADKLTLRLRAPRGGDVVVLRSPVASEGEVVKRVIAVGGQSVELREKKVIVDGRPLDEPYVQHTRAGERLLGDDLGPLAVPKDAVFVLGDNRDESDDSSVWKGPDGERIHFVPVDDVRGLVRGVY